MRFGLMLRTLDEKGGIGVYTRFLLQELMALDRRNEYVLFYRNPAHVGRYGHLNNVAERVVRGVNRAWWDQVAIPLACRREGVDVVFHPKFTVPFLAPCPAVMVLHGADWLVPEWARFYHPLDVAYIRSVMPAYCRRASVVLSVSRITTELFYRVLKLPPGRVRTVYFGPAKHFRRVEDPAALEAARQRYGLPQRYVLTLAKHGDGGRKNFDGVLRAFEHAHRRVPHDLVVGGGDPDRFRREYGIPEDGFGARVRFLGWVEQEDLPALYSLADAYLYPSRLEAFPIPLTEAMACGAPIVTSRANGLQEIAGEAALLVDPEDPAEIADALCRVLEDPELRARLSAAGLERSRMFSWERCAREVLQILEEVAAGGRRWSWNGGGAGGRPAPEAAGGA